MNETRFDDSFEYNGQRLLFYERKDCCLSAVFSLLWYTVTKGGI